MTLGVQYPMNQKEFQKRKSEIKNLYNQGNFEDAEALCLDLVYELFEEKQYSRIADLYNTGFVNPKRHLWIFEVAYALNEHGQYDEAERIYEFILASEPQNAAVLNNLSNLKKAKGEIDLAYDLIQKAFELDPKDEIISRNHENLTLIVHEREEIEANYKHALTYLDRENDFVIGKLKAFVNNARKDRDFKNGRMPIPRWKFKVLMGTDDQKARSLLDQWLDKGYLRRTGERGDYNEHIYEINPYLAKALTELKPTKINPKWVTGISDLNASKLEDLDYFEIVARVSKIKRSFRSILLRDIDELFLNYIMGNEKSAVILSGSIVESALIYYCEKKKISKISYQRHNRTINKKLYDCDLGDLLSFFEQNKLLANVVVHMGNISRVYRNFVHPGKELREAESLNQAKVNLCFMSTLEILKCVT